MGYFLGFGDGSSGLLTVSSDATTDLIIDRATCTGSSGSTTLSKGATYPTGSQFSTGRMVLIVQTRGTGAGNKEVNYISNDNGYSQNAGNVTLAIPLSNTYGTGAQMYALLPYSGITINSTKTLSAVAWDGTYGGILPLLSSGPVDISGYLSASGKGFRGGAGGTGAGGGQQGESYAGTQAYAPPNTANYSSGGAGHKDPTNGVWHQGAAGGGGGYGTAGQGGYWSGGANTGAPGLGGSTVGDAPLAGMFFGGSGGGGGADGGTGGAGGAGGGTIFIIAPKITVTGGIYCNGLSGGSGTDDQEGAGGSGAGGSVFIITREAVCGTSLITATGGSSTTRAYSVGGQGGSGRIRIEACSRTGTTNPSASEQIGGQNYCSVSHAIL